MKKEYIVPESICAQMFGDAVLLQGSPGDRSGEGDMNITGSNPGEDVEEDDVLVKGLRW